LPRESLVFHRTLHPRASNPQQRLCGTVEWYRYSLKAFQPVLEAEFDAMVPFRASVIRRIGERQQQGRGNKAVSVNTYLRCLKAFMNWAQDEQIVKEPFKLPWLKEEGKILATFTAGHIGKFVNWKPVRANGPIA
jgi:hypothetical protein